MRVFEKPNVEFGWKCPVCGKDDVRKVVLVSVAGTEDGRICEGEQFHVDCVLNGLWFYKDSGLVALKVGGND